jgi:arginine/ornithine transport system substrate-binding protein
MTRTLASVVAAAGLAFAGPALALNICVEGAYPPFSETAPDGSIIGFDIDIANALCDEMGEDCTLVKTDWDGIIPALLEGHCDAIIASMSITPERAQVIDFSEKYYHTPATFAAAADADFTDTPEDMAGKVVGVQRGTIHQDYLERMYPETRLTLYASQDEAYLDLVSGRLDAIMADIIAVDEGFLSTPQGEGFALLGEAHSVPEIHGEGAGIGVRQGEEELRDRFSEAIQAIREDGTYDEIMGRYFDFDIYGS